MSGKTPLLTQLTDLIGAFRRDLAAALADGVIDQREQTGLMHTMARAHMLTRRAELAQRHGMSYARYGEPARDQMAELAQVEALAIDELTKRTA